MRNHKVYIPDRNLEFGLFENIYPHTHPLELPRDYDKIKVLEISCRGIKDMTGIEYCRNLEVLSCCENEFPELILSDFPKLKILHCWGGGLEKLDLSGCPELMELMCMFNDLTELDVSHCPNLQFLYCRQNRLTSLDTTLNRKLEYMNVSDNNLRSLRISGLTDNDDCVLYNDNPDLELFDVVFD